LFNELKKFNLSINLVKTETLTFLPPRIRTQDQSVEFTLNNTPLTKVELFKYLGIFISANWGFSCHITRMQGRAEAAAMELTRLAVRLDIRSLGRISVFFRSLVESQWHGLEIMPLAIASEIESTRAHFVKKFFDLPCSTANMLTLVLLDLWPAAFDALMRRIAFANRMVEHDLDFVRNAFEFDRTVLFRAKIGWHHEAFLLFRSLFNREKIADFSIQRVSVRLSVIQGARDRFLFFLLKETSEATLAPFRLFSTPGVLLSFRSLLGQISKESAHLLLLTCSSGLRFRFFNRPALRCPLCSQGSWLTEHLFQCKNIEPLLARNNVSYADFRHCMTVGDWKGLLFLLHEVLMTWKLSFSDCLIGDDALRVLLADAESL
jgi:hypothetical protein